MNFGEFYIQAAAIPTFLRHQRFLNQFLRQILPFHVWEQKADGGIKLGAAEPAANW